MEYTHRYQELLDVFRADCEFTIAETGVLVKYLAFHSQLPPSLYLDQSDEQICENIDFSFPVFLPEPKQTYQSVILLLHGLNERSWNKYFTWAEFLCVSTGKPVIMFPLAFHINRSPLSWSNPRFLKPLLDLRRTQTGNDRSLSFANLALSKRISENPFRFYLSGRQSLNDITSLIQQIKSGAFSFLSVDAHVDVFSYSIGSFLSQIAFLSDREGYFANSKLFMFCGGSIFSSMFGESRSIMDKAAFDKLYDFYKNEFSGENEHVVLRDETMEAFLSMIIPERNTEKRETFFSQMGQRLKGISLVNDKVIPYAGVVQALGKECAAERIQILDFPYHYDHEQPFPLLHDAKASLVDKSFLKVFEAASLFLAG